MGASWTNDRERAAHFRGEIEPDVADGLAALLSWGGGPLAAEDDDLIAAPADDGVVGQICADLQDLGDQHHSAENWIVPINWFRLEEQARTQIEGNV